MLDTSPNAPANLRARTRERNQSVWAAMLSGTPLALDEAILNSLYLSTIEAPIAITDEVMAVKEYERDQTHAIDSQQVALERQAVQDGFDFVQSRLTDLYALWQIKDRIEAVKIQNTNDLITETLALLTVEKAGEDLNLTAIQNDQTVQAYEKAQTSDELAAEQDLKNQLVAAKEALQNVGALSREQISTLRMQMELLVNATKQWVFLNQDRVHLASTTKRLLINSVAQ